MICERINFIEGTRLSKFQWIDNAATERLLEDIRKANRCEFDASALAAAPLLEHAKIIRGYCYALSGVVSGHPRLEDDKEIVTSQLFWMDEELGVCRSMNRWYRLVRSNIKGH